MKRKSSVSHDQTIVRRLRKDPEFAAEYLKAALEDEDEPRVLLIALRHVAQARGIAKVAKTAYLDPTDKAGKAVTVDVAPVEPLKQPVTLAAIKADPKFKEMGVVRQSRLSVSPVGDEHWNLILKMAGAAK